MEQKLYIPSSKGKIATVIHQPVQRANRLAILCPGYLDSKDYTHLVELARQLAIIGYTAVRFDPTGTWESDGAIEDYDTTQYLADIQSVIDYMSAKEDYTHILIAGHSHGGFVSMLSSARDRRITMVISVMGSTGGSVNVDPKKHTAWERDGYSISTRDLPEDRSKKREYRVPYSHQADREKYNVLAELPTIHVPILFIVGEKDVLVTPSDVREAYELANEPKELVTMANMGHDYRLNINEVREVNERILEFAQKHI